MRISSPHLSAVLLTAFCASPLFAAPDDWAEGAPGHSDGANHTYYNRAGALPWRNREGDWLDAQGKKQGDNPFAAASVPGGRADVPIEWDVTELVRQWASGKLRSKGVLLRNTNGSGDSAFHSREVEQAANRPRLVVEVGGQPRTFEAVADTHLNRSTYRSMGNGERIVVSGSLPALVRFDLSELKPADRIAKATLRLVSVGRSGTSEVGVFACDQGEVVEPMDPILGLAQKYPADRGIEKDPDVLFATGFEAENWKEEWSRAGGQLEAVAAHPENEFEPFQGKACRVLLAKGNTGAMNTLYNFMEKDGSEPEEIYFRYYLRFGDDWNPTVDGGKMPGFSGRYARYGWAGNGGARVNGKNGWSARGSFKLAIPEGNPLAGKQGVGYYCYHADMQGSYGSGWVWNQGYRGFLDNNRWYCVEQYAKMNTLGADGEEGKRDGILRAWIDGRPAFEKTDIRFRDLDEIKISQIWFNVYHGGTRPSHVDQHLYIDNAVIAKKYIGPLKDAPAAGGEE
ncbi:MAG: disaggregatase related repeat-containing protein [Planctomycetaceae bacterium]